jgi:hypothetical protein
MNHSTRLIRRPWRAWPTAARTAAAVAVLAGTASAAGVGFAATPAQLGNALAFSRCMRAHGVPNFPDPNSSGVWPKTEVKALGQANPSLFDSANRTCGDLIPSGGNGETAGQIAELWNQFRQYARCMRHHGVPNYPDPSSRSATDRRPTFNLAASGLNPSSPQLRATAQQCAALLHRAGLSSDASMIP